MSDIAQINNFVEQQRFNDAAWKKKFFILFWLQCAIMCACFNPTILTIIIYKTPSILLTPGVNCHKLIHRSIKRRWRQDIYVYTYEIYNNTSTLIWFLNFTYDTLLQDHTYYYSILQCKISYTIKIKFQWKLLRLTAKKYRHDFRR